MKLVCCYHNLVWKISVLHLQSTFCLLNLWSRLLTETFFFLWLSRLQHKLILMILLSRIFFSAPGGIRECTGCTWRPESLHPEGYGQNQESKDVSMIALQNNIFLEKYFKSYAFLSVYWKYRFLLWGWFFYIDCIVSSQDSCKHPLGTRDYFALRIQRYPNLFQQFLIWWGYKLCRPTHCCKTERTPRWDT